MGATLNALNRFTYSLINLSIEEILKRGREAKPKGITASTLEMFLLTVLSRKFFFPLWYLASYNLKHPSDVL